MTYLYTCTGMNTTQEHTHTVYVSIWTLFWRLGSVKIRTVGSGAKTSAVNSDTAQIEVLASIFSPSLLLTLGMEPRALHAKHAFPTKLFSHC